MDMSHSTNVTSYLSSPTFTTKEMNSSDTEPADLSGEKKRNRLGYARTNMACGNCRKRKIRCLLVKDDGRCTQCIRLKKNCQFYAVDQGPVGAGSRPLSQTMLALEVSPQQMAPCCPGDMQAHQVYHGGMAACHEMRPSASGSDAYLDNYELGPGVSGTGPYGYDQDADSWASMPKQEVDMNASWRGYSPEPAGAPDYTPYGVPGNLTWSMSPVELTAEPEGTPRPEDAWSPYPQPSRSMSFSGEHMMPAYDDRKGSVSSDIYHPTSIDAVLPNPYPSWQLPFQP